MSQAVNRNYLGNHVYENDTLKRTITPVGFLMNDTLYAYVKDYRGNIRSVIDEFGNVVETNHYYPYGGLLVDILEPKTSVQPLKFEGKEFDREYGLSMYDYHARLYDPYLCGFDNRDPQAEKYPDISPYAFCAANPNRFIDPTGEEIRINYTGSYNYCYVIYQNGALQPQNGLTNSKYPDFVYQVLEDLNKLNQIGGNVSKRLDELQNSNQIFDIVESNVNSKGKSTNSALAKDVTKINNGEPTGGTVFYNPNSKTSINGSTLKKHQRPAVVGLAHELLGHCYDYSIGMYLNRKEIKSNNVSINEIRAIDIENQVRKALGENLRNSYHGYKIY